ncbi:hypothetical protein KP509_24G054900 [Ceratopteris richardii]|uniref:DCD domain-containing protein n=1 Tax=Ceratopteris richardii TaxID=49495 RepID=A0A8T2RX62_CERRI|nr:hypothetical protein KP509_24G054900 [Ceratopteris richardii]
MEFSEGQFQAYGQSDAYDEKNPSRESVNTDVSSDFGQCAGLIFMCDESTKVDCFKYRVFGLPKSRKDLVDMLATGMYLFLFDAKLKVLHGIYAASSAGGFNLEPKAFGGSFPCQVKFHIVKECKPLAEDVFKEAIQENYFSARRFRLELTSLQVQKLVNLFNPMRHCGSNIKEPCTSIIPNRRIVSPVETSQTCLDQLLECDLSCQTAGPLVDVNMRNSCSHLVMNCCPSRNYKPMCSVKDLTRGSAVYGFLTPDLSRNNHKLSGFSLPKDHEHCMCIESESEVFQGTVIPCNGNLYERSDHVCCKQNSSHPTSMSQSLCEAVCIEAFEGSSLACKFDDQAEVHPRSAILRYSLLGYGSEDGCQRLHHGLPVCDQVQASGIIVRPSPKAQVTCMYRMSSDCHWHGGHLDD